MFLFVWSCFSFEIPIDNTDFEVKGEKMQLEEAISKIKDLKGSKTYDEIVNSAIELMKADALDNISAQLDHIALAVHVFSDRLLTKNHTTGERFINIHVESLK